MAMSKNILLAEDDCHQRKFLAFLLKKEGWAVDAVPDGQAAIEYLQERDYDIVLLDWMMPKASGLEVCQFLRRTGKNCGIIFMTARDATDDKVMGLDSGADDYLVKPIAFSELSARLRSLMRRRLPPCNDVLRHACGLRLDLKSCCAFSPSGDDLSLTRREFQLLKMLLKNAGQVLPREVIMSHIWGDEDDVTPNALDAIVKLLRRKIEAAGLPPIIRTVHGIGYKIER